MLKKKYLFTYFLLQYIKKTIKEYRQINKGVNYIQRTTWLLLLLTVS
jgi:hypothetical protein